jgi:transcriptional regulator with XRE-family HTH domain
MLEGVAWWARAKARREALKISGVELAARLRVSNQRVSDWEAGRYPNPRIDTLAKLAAALGVRVDDLVGDDFGVTYPGSPPVQAGSSNASDSYAPATPRRADDGPATRRLEPVTIPDHLDAAEAAVYLTDLARDLADGTAARLRAVAQALLARELEHAIDVTAGVRGTDREPHQPHARRRRTHRRGA